MKTMRMGLVSTLAASVLALTACGDAYETDPAANGEDSAMTTTNTEGTSANPPPPATGNAGMPSDAEDGDADNPPADDACGASEVAKYVGQEATPDVRARIIADVGHTRIRWIGPDTVVTMDYSPERLNVTMDADDVITGANCA